MDLASLRHFCKKEGFGRPSRHAENDMENCHSLEHRIPSIDKSINLINQLKMGLSIWICLRLQGAENS
uniref:Uncharacterized protein n=1 Tax=Manihot esculenta TaxID=3983 RepID=A0A251K652_MANES